SSGIEEISCSSPGDCTGVGQFGIELFAISQVRGHWSTPVTIPSTIRSAKPSSGPAGVRCFSSGNCLLIGTYTDAAGHPQAFTTTQSSGSWHKVSWVPGLAQLDRGHSSGFGYLSCPSAGNCTAEGTYTDASKNRDPFTVTEVHGTWGQAKPVTGLTGTALPGQLGNAALVLGPISCPSPGNC